MIAGKVVCTEEEGGHVRPINIFFTCTGSETWARDTGPGAGLLCASPAPRHWLDLKQQNGALGQPPLPAMEVPDLPACGPCAVTAEPPPTSPALQHPHHSLWSMRAGLKLGLRPDLQKGCLGSPGGQLGWAHQAALPVSRACGPPRGGGLGVGGRRYTTCTRPCSASLAASPFSRGSMKNSSSSIRIRPACKAKTKWFKFPEHSRPRMGSSKEGPRGPPTRRTGPEGSFPAPLLGRLELGHRGHRQGIPEVPSAELF